MNSCRLTVVVDNKAEDGLAAEHGFSLHIETPDKNILLDTGQKDAFLSNLDKLDISLSHISALVLSHGHYDHTGGVADMLRLNKRLELYIHAGVFQPRYSLDGEEPAVVKMPLAAMESIMHHAENKTHWLTQPEMLSRNVGVIGPIPRQTDFEDTGGAFFLDPQGTQTDSIQDDTAVYIKTEEGLVICVGCCHSGLVNTLTRITEVSGESRIHTVIGGLHLLNAAEERLAKTVESLAGFEVSRIVACHCSGEAAVEYLEKHLSAEVMTGYAGMVVEV